MTWDEWADKHATIYGLNDNRDLAMLAFWGGIFGDEGWTPEELLAASRWVASHDPPKFRDGMLRSLQDRVRGLRVQQRGSAGSAGKFGAGPFDLPGECSLCYWTGWRHVPCPKAHAAGHYKEILACCICPLGRLRLSHGDQRPSLELWLERWPDWRNHQDAHERARRAAGEASEQAGKLDLAMGELRPPALFKRLLDAARSGGTDTLGFTRHGDED